MPRKNRNASGRSAFEPLTIDEADALDDSLLRGSARLAERREFSASLESLEVANEVMEMRRAKWNAANPDWAY